MQEANVNGVKGYPMLSSHTTNKEVMSYNKWCPIGQLIISMLYDYTVTYEYLLGLIYQYHIKVYIWPMRSYHPQASTSHCQKDTG